METLRVPGASSQTVDLCLRLVEADLKRTKIQVADANEIRRVDRDGWRHLPRRPKMSKQWFADKRRRIAKLETAQDELRRISQAYQEARRQREQEALHDGS